MLYIWHLSFTAYKFRANMTEIEKIKEKIDSFKERIADPDTDPSMLPELKNSLQRQEKKLLELKEKESEAEANAEKSKKEAEQKAKEKEETEAKAKKDSLEARVNKIKGCVPDLAQARETLNAWHAKKQAEKTANGTAEPVKKRPITKIFADKFSAAFNSVFAKETTLEKVEKINVAKLEAAKGDFVSGLKKLREGFGGIKGDGFIDEISKNFDDLIEKVNEKKKQVEEQEND
jgi:DNA repair exonuclease SbcCD ATPase subunit